MTTIKKAGILSLGLLFISLGLFLKFQNSSQPVLPTTQVSSNSETKYEVWYTPIKDIGLGTKVPGENPVEVYDDLFEEVDPATWKQIECTVVGKAEGKSEVSLLRPDWWIQENGLSLNGSFRIELPEVGISGKATVNSIGPCPEIQEGPGSVIIGKFRHTSDDVWDLKISGSSEVLGTTGVHPFFSVTRGQFIAARDLQTGETLLRLDGQKQVVESLVKSSKASEVYNLEIHGVHVFHVGKTGVLVHNNCFDYFKRLGLTDELAQELADLNKAGSYVKSYKRLLAEGHGDAAKKYAAFMKAKKAPNNGISIFSRESLQEAQFSGRKVFKWNDAFDPQVAVRDVIDAVELSKLSPKAAKIVEAGGSNVDLMKAGFAPIGKDGLRINLHHVIGEEPGPMVELMASLHQRHTKPIHAIVERPTTMAGSPGKPVTKIPRSFRKNADGTRSIKVSRFDAFKRRYWIWRALDF